MSSTADFTHLRRGRPLGGQYTGGLDAARPIVFVQCSDCRLGIQDSFVQAAVPETANHHAQTFVFHTPNCFKCWRCSALLGEDYWVKGERPYCETHGHGGSKGLPLSFGDARGEAAAGAAGVPSRCGQCHRDLGVDDAVVTAKNDQGQDVSFHKHCFQCMACQVSLESGYALVEGQVHCLECAQAKLDVQVRKRIEESVRKAREDAARRCAEEEEKLDAARQLRVAALRAQVQAVMQLQRDVAGGACEACQEAIPEAAAVTVGADTFHQACFKCSKCSQSLDRITGGVLRENARVCHGCAGHHCCVQCDQVIRPTGGRSTISGKHMHEHCALCMGCWQPLSHDVVRTSAEGRLVCGECS